MKTISFLALAGLAAGTAAAQMHAPRDPSDRAAQVPPVQYRSAFEDYQPYTDPTIANWRDANDGVRALGGHAGHAAKPGVTRAAQPGSGSTPARTQGGGNAGPRP